MIALSLIPRKAWLILAALVAIAGAVVWLRHEAVQDERAGQREAIIQREKDISDAVKDSDAAPDWRDQLRNRHQ